MMTPEQKAARLELIKAASKKYDFRQKQKANAAKVRRWTDIEERPRRVKADRDFDRTIAKMDENYNCWTDSSAYAKQYYGEVYSETTKFDNDWD